MTSLPSVPQPVQGARIDRQDSPSGKLLPCHLGEGCLPMVHSPLQALLGHRPLRGAPHFPAFLPYPAPAPQ